MPPPQIPTPAPPPDPTTPPPNYPPSKHSTNSFSHKPSFPQLFAYVVIIAQVIVYGTCLYPLCGSFVLLGFYVFFGGVMVVAKVVCSCANPTDLVVYRYKWSKCEKSVSFTNDFTQYYYCQYCQSFCRIKSKHCKICNRCTQNFDHHCVWINNCIGSRNYTSFITLILSTFCHIAVFLIAGALFTSSVRASGQVQLYLGYGIAVWVCVVVLGVLEVMLLQLIILHVYLRVKGITTYQFLVDRRRAQQQAQQRKQQQQKAQISNHIIVQPQPKTQKLNYIQQTKIQIKPKQKPDQKAAPQNSQTVKQSVSQIHILQRNGVQNAALEGLMDLEEDNDKEEMPSFLTRNRSLKIIFGATEVMAPGRQRKRMKTLI